MTDAPTTGHNSGDSVAEHTESTVNATGARLRSFVERIERLNEEKAALTIDINEVFGELHSDGFDKKAVRAILKVRKMDPAEQAEHEAIFETYLSALGM